MKGVIAVALILQYSFRPIINSKGYQNLIVIVFGIAKADFCHFNMEFPHTFSRGGGPHKAGKTIQIIKSVCVKRARF